MIRPVLFFLLFFSFIFASEEDLFVKRLIAFWKDEQYELLSHQIETFLQEYPKSAHFSDIQIIKAHLLTRGKKYDEAISVFESIPSLNENQNAYLLYLEALFQTKSYQKLLSKISLVLNHSDFQQKKQTLLYLKTQTMLHLLKELPEEKAKAFLKEAEADLDLIYEAEYKVSVLKAKLFIAKTLNDQKTSIHLAKELSHLVDEKEEYLFLDACETISIDSKLAIVKFKRLSKYKHPFQAKSLYNLLILLFKEKHFEEIIELKPYFSTSLEESDLPLFELYLACSYKELKNFKQAVAQYQKALHLDHVPEDRKNALLELAICTYTLEDETQFGHALTRLKSEFPEEKNIPELEFGYAKLLCKNKLYHKAQKVYEHLLQLEHLEKKEEVLKEFIFLLFQQDQTHHILYHTTLYLKQFNPQEQIINIHIDRALKLKDVNRIEPLVFLTTLKNMPKELKEKIDYSLATVYYDTKNYTQAKAILETLEKTAHAYIAKVHYLLCLLSQNDLELSTHYLELALKENMSFEDLGMIHIHLFNAYLQIHNENKALKSWHINKECPPETLAAEHLYKAFKIAPNKIKQDNLLFLAQWAYKEAKQKKECQNAHALFAFIFKECQLEHELYFDLKKKQAKLFKWQNKCNAAIDILQQLLNNAQTDTQKCTLCYKLGLLYKAQRRHSIALNYFKEAIKTKSFCKAHNFSKFEVVNLEIDQCQDPQRQVELLSYLKDLQVKKCIQYEPLFLDASLLYIDLITSSLPKPNQDERRLFLLKRMQEDFTNENDIFSKEYHTQLKKNDDKRYVYNCYMQFVAQKIAFLEAKIQNNQKQEKRALDILLEKRDEYIRLSNVLEKQLKDML
jgi:tetratricopeptide (TPR) repeat protein